MVQDSITQFLFKLLILIFSRVGMEDSIYSDTKKLHILEWRKKILNEKDKKKRKGKMFEYYMPVAMKRGLGQ